MAASLDRDALVEFSTIGYKLMPPGPLKLSPFVEKGAGPFLRVSNTSIQRGKIVRCD
jgi:hypothetical protein